MKQSIRCCKLAALSQALAALSQSATFAWLWLAPMREGHNVRALGATTVRPARGVKFGERQPMKWKALKRREHQRGRTMK